jgi:tetratricopeptide (TPR) repeat protein
MQRYGEAETCLIKALEHYPNDHSLRLKLLQTELSLKKYMEIVNKFKNWDEAGHFRNEGLETRKDSDMRSEINYVAAYAYYKLGRYSIT